jgi:hypothetical protein
MASQKNTDQEVGTDTEGGTPKLVYRKGRGPKEIKRETDKSTNEHTNNPYLAFTHSRIV